MTEPNDSLRNAIERFRPVIERHPHAVVVFDGEGTVVLASRVADAMLLHAPGAMPGRQFEELLDCEQARLLFVPPNPDSGSGSHLVSCTFEDVDALLGDGSRVRVGLSIDPQVTPEGVLVFATLSDSAEPRRRSTDRLEADARYRSLVEGLPLNVFCKDLHGRVTFANQRCLSLMGMTLEQFTGRTDHDLFPPELADKYRRDDAKVISSGEPFEDVEEYCDPGGRRSYVQVFKAPIRNASGEVIGIQGMFWDVTPRKRAERSLLESETRKSTILAAAFDAIVMAHREGAIVEFNDAAREMFGYPIEDIRGADVERLFPQESREMVRTAVKRLLSDEGTEERRRFETPAVRADGSTFDAEVSMRSIPVDDRPALVVFLRDVTEQRRVRAELERERFLLASLMDHVPDNVYFKDAEGRYLRINKAKAERSGIEDPADAVGRSDFDFFDREHAEKAIEDEREVMRTGEPMVGEEERLVWPDGRVTWSSTTKVPLRDESGSVVGTFGISRDVTDQKRAREAMREAKEAAEAASRAKSDFLANTSHEIRTPMNAIIGMTELLLDDENLDARQREYLSIVRESSESLLGVINSVLDFSKIESGHLELAAEPFNIREVLGDGVKSLAVRAHRKELELAFHIAPEVPAELLGDHHRLRQVVVNLVGNAIKFTDEGEVVVDVGVEGRENDRVVLGFSVRDTGVGIPADKIDSVFEAFQQADASSSRRFGGTGLGLSISAHLVEMMGGRIEVESEEGRGSTFRFTVEFEVARETEAPPVRVETLTGLRVLVVDDNETNRRIVAEMLTNWGMSAREAVDVRDAEFRLKEALQIGRPFELVLSDVQMPYADGYDLARHIRTTTAIALTPIVLLTSGDRPEDAERRREWSVNGHLHKPVKQSDLFDAIVAAVGARPADDEERKPLRAHAGRTCRILLVEDSIPNQKLAIGLLEKWGHRASVASNGRIAVDFIEDGGTYDVILMDVQMPEMDGLDATRAIRAFEAGTGRRTPIIAMTAHAMAEDRERCLEAGMDSYVSKPIRPSLLQETIQTLVAAPPSVDVSPGNPASNDAAASPDPIGGEPGNGEAIVQWNEALAIAGDDRDLLKLVLDGFVEEFDDSLGRLRAGVAARDAGEIARWGHKLKGACRSIAATPAQDVLEELERLGKSGELDGLDELAGRVEAMMPRLRAEVDAFRAGENG